MEWELKLVTSLSFNDLPLFPNEFQTPHHDLYHDPCTKLPALAEKVSSPNLRCSCLPQAINMCYSFLWLVSINPSGHRFLLLPSETSIYIRRPLFHHTLALFFSFIIQNQMCNSRARAGRICLLYTLYTTIYPAGLPRWISGKESACLCRRHGRHGFNLWIGQIPWCRKWQPTQVFLPGEFHEQ